MQNYIALIRKDPETSYGVNFPDFPGLVTGGENLEQALHSAREGLAFHIEGLEEDGIEIPEPSSLEAIVADPENRDAIAVLIQGPIRKGKAVRINVTFDENLLARIEWRDRPSKRGEQMAKSRKVGGRAGGKSSHTSYHHKDYPGRDGILALARLIAIQIAREDDDAEQVARCNAECHIKERESDGQKTNGGDQR